MRLFIGIDIPEPITQSLVALIDKFRPAARLRWSPAANFHITVKFVGEWPEGRLDELRASLSRIQQDSIPIAIRGMGWFPNPHNPRTFFAAVHGGESLPALAAKTEDAVVPLGIAKETRAYSPHLTLARIQDQPNLTELRQAVASLPSDKFGEFTAGAFHLYLSQPGQRGSVYSKLASFSLSAI